MADVIDDSTQLPVEGADATQAFLAGQAEVSADPDGRVRVIANGRLGSVDARELETFLRTNPGARLATAQERQERLLQREYGEGIGNELRAAGEAALRTMTLGLSDVAIGAAGGEEAREGLREREARNRLAAATGTGVGIVATALATGGTGALARGLSATPAGLAMRGGEALIGLGRGAGVVGKAAAMAAGGAVEGALMGAGQGVSEWALNPDAQERTAERLMATLHERAGEGALLGGLAGGALSLGGSAVGAGARKAKHVLGKLFSRADDVADDAARMLSRADGVADDIVALEAGRTLGKQGPLNKLVEGSRARQEFAHVQQRATTRISDDITQMNRTAEELFGRTGGVERKRSQVAKLFKNDPPRSFDVTNAETIARLERIDDELSELVTQTAYFEKNGLRAFREVRNDITQIASSLRTARNADELADIYAGMDRLKRRIGHETKAVLRGAVPDNGAHQVLDRHYHDLMRFLEDDDIWGTAAAGLQRENNAALSSYLDFGKAFDDTFALSAAKRTTKGVTDPFSRVPDADPSKVGAALRAVDKAENAKVEEILLVGAKRQADMLETLAKNYDLGPEQMAKVKAARKAAQRIEKEFNELKRLRQAGEKFDEVVEGLKTWTLGSDRAATAVASGGRLVGAAMERLGNLNKIWMSSENVGSKITQVAQRYARNFGTTSAKAITGGAATGGTRADRQQRFEKAYARVQEFERDPQAAIRRAFRVQHSLGTVAPTLAGAYAAKTVQAGAFLASKLPVGATAAHMFPRHKQGEAPRVSDVEMREFLEYVDAIERPMAILDQLEKGRVSPRTVEAVREVYPKLYEDIQREIMTAIEDAETTPPYNARLNLGILFDLPTDAALEPDALQMLQTSANAPGADQAAQNPDNQAILSPSRRSAPDTAGLLETKSVRSMGAL